MNANEQAAVYRNAAIEAAVTLGINPYESLSFEQLEATPEGVRQTLDILNNLASRARDILVVTLKADRGVDKDIFQMVLLSKYQAVKLEKGAKGEPL